MGILLLGVWGNRTITIPNCIALERVKSIFDGMGIRGRFLYVVVDLSLTTSVHIQLQHGCFCYQYHAEVHSRYPVPSRVPFDLVCFKPMPVPMRARSRATL